MQEALAELQFITQSESRSKTIAALADAESLDKRELESQLDASYRTVVRVVKSLKERGYLTETDRGLQLTSFGSHIADQLDEFVTATDVALEFKPLLRHAPPALQDLDLETLAGAELLVASDSDPFSILDRVLTLRADATRIREVAPGIEKKSIDQLAERIQRNEDVGVEAVISQRSSDLAESRVEYRDGHAATVESDSVDIYLHPEEISFFAGTMDDTAVIAVSKNGQPYALAVSDDPDLRAVTESVFEKYRAESTLKTSM